MKVSLALEGDSQLRPPREGERPVTLWPVPPPAAVDRNDWSIDLGLWVDLHRRFRFTVDAASSHENALLERHWTIQEDGLRRPWTGERVWCNPPYSDLEPWITKAWVAYLNEGAELVVLLLPATRTEQAFWQERIEPYRDGRSGYALRVEFLRGRPQFKRAGQRRPNPHERPPFGVCLVIWGE